MNSARSDSPSTLAERFVPSVLAGAACAFVLLLFRLVSPGTLPPVSALFMEMFVFFLVTGFLTLASQPLILRRAFYLVPFVWGLISALAKYGLMQLGEPVAIGQPIWASLAVSFGTYFLLGLVATTAYLGGRKLFIDVEMASNASTRPQARRATGKRIT